MKKYIIVTFLLTLLIHTNVLAQVNNTEPVSCFDYYKFGSVYASLETRNYSNVSGTKINFFGEIKNDNAYPIVDGKLFVKIMRQNDSYDKTGGQDELDSFVVKEGISIPANSSVPISFDWDIPGYAISGEYQASTYFLVDDSFNMSGLTFTTDIVGGVAKFSVTGEQKRDVYFDRTKIVLNDNPYYTVAFTPAIGSTSTANIKLTLTNDTDKIQEVPVTLSLYEWDAQAKKNLLKTEDTGFLIDANSSREIQYEITDTSHSVYFLVAKAKYKDAKSEVSVRFGREGKQEPRINFSTFATYPFEKGKENSLITCVHNTNNIDAEYGKVVTTVYDHKGNPIHTSTYEGKITGAIQGMISKFTPKANYKDLSIQTKIYDKDGNIFDESNVEYKCSDLSDDCKEPLFAFDTKTIITIIALLLLIGIILLIKKFNNKRNLVTPLMILFVLGVMLVPQVGEGKYTSKAVYYNSVNGDTNLISGNSGTDQQYSWQLTNHTRWGLNNISLVVNYFAYIINTTTGSSLIDGDEVKSGDKLKFVFSRHIEGPVWDNIDVVWWVSGGTFDTPYGQWLNYDSHPTSFSYVAYQPMYSVYGGIDMGGYGTGNIYGAVTVHPPGKVLSFDPEILDCGPFQEGSLYMECTVKDVNDDKNIDINFIYQATRPRAFLYKGDASIDRSYWNIIVSDTGRGTGIYNPLIDEAYIPFTLKVQKSQNCLTNATPTAPTIGINPASPIVDEFATITLSSTDADNDPITYQVDWGDGNAITVTSPFTKKWSTTETGTKTFKARAIDTCGESEWVEKSVTVVQPPQPQTPILVEASKTCTSATLSWNKVDGETYNLYEDGSLILSNVNSPHQVTGLSEKSTNKFKLSAIRGTQSAFSNELTVNTPYCLPQCVDTQENGCSVPGSVSTATAIDKSSTNLKSTWKCSYQGQTTGPCVFNRLVTLDPDLSFVISPKVMPACEAEIIAKDVKSCQIKKGGDNVGDQHTPQSGKDINEPNIRIEHPGTYYLDCIKMDDTIITSPNQSCISEFNIIQR